MKPLPRLLLLASLTALLPACNSGPKTPDGIEVVILRGHTHSRYCGHYRYQDTWYYVPLHKHGEGCGHEFDAGVWALLED